MALPDDLPEFLKPRLRLFLSADIVGSTALKQSPRDGRVASTEWFVIIQGFYVEAQRNFLAQWDRYASVAGADAGSAPELWKVIGDEITFTKVLSSQHDLYAALSCWCAAMQDVRKWVRSKSGRLDVKCTGWTAGFPVMNKEVIVRSGHQDPFQGTGDYFVESGNLLNERYNGGDKTKFSVDYIGPAIDIGFRLTSHATPRKFVLSVGASYLLSVATPSAELPFAEFKMRYDGAFPLKGVFGGAPYPIFWIDMAAEGELARLEDDLLPPPKCGPDAVRRYCTKYYQDNHAYTFLPFMEGAHDHSVRKRPTWYDEALANLLTNYLNPEIPDRSTELAAETERPSDAPPAPRGDVAAIMGELVAKSVGKSDATGSG